MQLFDPHFLRKEYFVLLSLALLSSPLFAEESLPNQEKKAIRVDASVLEGQSQAPQKHALAWLEMVDKREYRQSWFAASYTLQRCLDQASWMDYLNRIRSPLGSVDSRHLQCQWNQGCSQLGETRIVLQFETKFSRLSSVHEWVILDYGCDFFGTKRWRVAGYSNDVCALPVAAHGSHTFRRERVRSNRQVAVVKTQSCLPKMTQTRGSFPHKGTLHSANSHGREGPSPSVRHRCVLR